MLLSLEVEILNFNKSSFSSDPTRQSVRESKVCGKEERICGIES